MMKKFLAVAGLLAVMAGSAAAQGGGGGGGGMGRGGGRGTPEQQDSVTYSRYFNGITLDAAAMAKAKEIITKAREANMAMDRQAPDMMEKMQAANAKRTADLKALVSADADKTKFDENAAAMGRGGRRGGGH